jgi:hypothetical protein
MVIDKYHFPTLIIAAFILGMVLAMLLGFRPEHSGGKRGEPQGHPAPVTQVISAAEIAGCGC